MNQNRRDLLAQALMASAGLPLSSRPGTAADAPIEGGLPSVFDEETYRFWTKEIRSPSLQNLKQLRGGAIRAPTFIYHDAASGFRRSENIDDSHFPKSGNVKIRIRVLRFRPSTATAAALKDTQSGSLRVDVKQTAPLPSLQEALAWTATAAFVPKSGGSLPDLKDLSFDPGDSWGSLTQIPLSNGSGFWSWNFFVKRPRGVWGNFIEIFRKADKVVFPLLSLPGIATTALGSLDQLFGYLQASGSSQWIFQSQDSAVYATQEGKSFVGSGLPLRTGHYVILPDNADQISTFGDAAGNLDIQGGYLVSKGADQFKWEANAAVQIPTVDYILIHVNVDPGALTSQP